MFVWRGSTGISLAFTTWPDGFNTVLSESRKLITGLLGPYQPAALASVPLKSTGNVRLDRVESTLAASADGGNTNASLMLGFLLNFPDASHLPDYPAAAYWYGKARDAGNAQAEYQLALLYLHGQGVPKNETLAVDLLKAASDQAYEPAVTRYGELILDDNLYGNGMYYAEPVLKKAMSLGSTDALYDLAMIAWANTRTTHTTGVYHPEQLFQQSAAKGNCKAYLGLGALYFSGDGVQQDGAAARSWFLKAKQCFRTSSSLETKADHWIAMIDTGQMPSKEDRQSISEGWSVVQYIAAAAAAVVVFETALHQNDPPQTKEEGEAELKAARCNGQSMMRSVYPPPGSIVGSPAWYNSIPECR